MFWVFKIITHWSSADDEDGLAFLKTGFLDSIVSNRERFDHRPNFNCGV
jgi:hypothetical protein